MAGIRDPLEIPLVLDSYHLSFVWFPSTVKFCLCLMPVDTAVKTDTIVAADFHATVRALPFLHLFFLGMLQFHSL